VAMNSSITWNITPCVPMKAIRILYKRFNLNNDIFLYL
jgi:hypothetical protein